MKTIIVIPARGNSKGIKKKNLLNFSKKPLLYWSIIQAKKTKFRKNIYVTSENEEILKLSKKLGVNVVKRPHSLSRDNSSSESAIKHVVKSLSFKVDNVIFLQATSPLRKPIDIDNAYKKFISSKSDCIFSCHKAQDWFDVWAKKGRKKNKFIPLLVNYKKRKPRQLFKEEHFMANGSIFIFKNKILNKYNNRLGGKINIYEMEEWQSFQLDDIKQLNIMEVLFNQKLKNLYV